MPAMMEITKFSAKTYSVPAPAMIAPARSGPITREVFTATAFSASASPSWRRGTTSGRIAEYTGQRIASPMPFANTSASSTGAVMWPRSAKT